MTSEELKTLAEENFKQSLDIKNKLQKLINDKSVSLEERWNCWCLFDRRFKNHLDHIPFGLKVTNKLPQRRVDWTIEPWWIEERGRLVQIDNQINEMENYLLNNNKSSHLGWSIELLNEFKEEVLEKNLGSFTFDW